MISVTILANLYEHIKHYSFKGDTLKWLMSSMKEREEYVSRNGCALNTVRIACGVPQGSILGPLIYLIYIHDFSVLCSFLVPFCLLMIPT